MIYLIQDTEDLEYELSMDSSLGSLEDLNVDGGYYFDYPPKLPEEFAGEFSNYDTIHEYLREYPELRLIGSFNSIADYNLYLDNSPELFV